MKKLILTLSLFIMAAGFCNAQLYIGGGIGVNSKSTSSDEGEVREMTSFSFSPRVGYVFSDKVLAGIELGFISLYGSNIDSFDFEYGDPDFPLIDDGSVKMFTIRPYVRYNFLTMGKFAVGAEAGLAYNTMKIKDAEAKMNGFGIDIAPVVTFAINKHWWIETKLDIFGLSYSTMTAKIDGGYMGEYKVTDNDFSFGLDTDNLLTLGAIKLGMVYRF